MRYNPSIYALIITLPLLLAACGSESNQSNSAGTASNGSSNGWQDQFGLMTVGENGDSNSPLQGERLAGYPIYIFDDGKGNTYRLLHRGTFESSNLIASDIVLEKRNVNGNLLSTIDFKLDAHGSNAQYSVSPYAVTLNSNGDRLYIATNRPYVDGYALYEVNLGNGEVLNEIIYSTFSGINTAARELRFSDGKLYLRYFSSGTIHVFDEDLNDLGKIATGMPYASYNIGETAWGSPAIGQTFAVEGDKLYALNWSVDRSIMAIETFTLVTNPTSGQLTANQFGSDWYFRLPDCFNCENINQSGPNNYGQNTEVLRRAYPGFWVGDNQTVYFPQMLYRDIAYPTYSINSVDSTGVTIDPDPLNASLFVLETKDFVKIDQETYIVGNVTTNIPNASSLGLGDQGFIMKLDGQTKDWIKLIEGGVGKYVNLTSVRSDGAGGISVTGRGTGNIEGVDFLSNSKFTVNYDSEFLANYKPDPSVEAQLQATAPPIEDFIIGNTWIYRPNGRVQSRIVLSEGGTGSVRTYDSTGTIDGVYSTLTWTIVDQDTLRFDYVDAVACDFYRGVWETINPSADTLFNISVSEDGIQFNGVTYDLSSGGNGNPQSGGGCSLL